jgi:PhnB protein
MYVPPGFATVASYIFADGSERLVEVADMPYGDRQGGISDPAGNIWWVSQRLVPGPYSS